MPHGELAYLIMVLGAFAIFIGVVGFISVWSQPKKALVPHRANDADHLHGHSSVRYG